MAYKVDTSKLKTNTSMPAGCFYVKRYGDNYLDVNKVLYDYGYTSDGLSTGSRTLYKQDGTTSYITGTLKISDSWAKGETLSEFDTSTSNYTYMARGSLPTFNLLCAYSAGIYWMIIKGSTLYLKSGSANGTVLKSWTGSDFKDGIIPDRMLLVMSGGGGGGSANAAVIALGVAAGGSDGGSGGSSGFFAVVINIESIKNESTAFVFTVGAGGAGGVCYDEGGDNGVGSWSGGPGYTGGSSSFGIAYQTGNTWTSEYPIIIATGGGGAPSHAQYEAGPAGAAGIVTNGSGKGLADGTEPSYKDNYWWWIPAFDINATSVGRSYEYGYAGTAAGDGSGQASPTRKLKAFSNASFYEPTLTMTIGGYSGGDYSTNSAGGAASFFGAGGRGGENVSNCQGRAGGTAAGGGGARYHAYVKYNGGAGGDGIMRLYY